MARLASAGNTNGPALYILERRRGYTVRVLYGDDEEAPWVNWIASKGEDVFFAESPEALLGVVTIYEKLGEAWRDQSAYDKRPIYERDPWEVL